MNRLQSQAMSGNQDTVASSDFQIAACIKRWTVFLRESQATFFHVSQAAFLRESQAAFLRKSQAAFCARPRPSSASSRAL
ncbi:hypothetical protein BG005_005260 [Podila minutissima]|nr:hypothetical protein BG005_005260 [Podila minutissima]